MLFNVAIDKSLLSKIQFHGDGVDDAGGDGGYAHTVYQPVSQQTGEVLCRECGAEEAGEGDADLNGGEEAGGLVHKDQHFFGGFIAVFRLCAEFIAVQRNDSDLRCGEECVQRDQNTLQKYLPGKFRHDVCLPFCVLCG